MACHRDTTLDGFCSDGSAGNYDFDRAVADEANTLGMAVPAEWVPTGGGCSSVQSCDGDTLLACTAMDGDAMFAVYRADGDSLCEWEWQPEHMVFDEVMPGGGTVTVAGVAARYAEISRTHLASMRPWVATSYAGVDSYASPAARAYSDTLESALAWASSEDAWSGGTRKVIVEDGRTGADAVHTYTTRFDAEASHDRVRDAR